MRMPTLTELRKYKRLGYVAHVYRSPSKRWINEVTLVKTAKTGKSGASYMSYDGWTQKQLKGIIERCVDVML